MRPSFPTRRFSDLVAAVAGFAKHRAGYQNRVAFAELRVRRRDHVAGDVDAADQRESTQDPALAGACQRVLEIDGRVSASDHELAGRQVVPRDPLDSAAVEELVALDAESFEVFTDRPEPSSGGQGRSGDAREACGLPPHLPPALRR